MAVDRLYKQRSVMHGIDGEELVSISADEESKTMGVNLRIWDTDSLEWVRMTRGMTDPETPSFATNRFEWSGENCTYKGSHADLNASVDDTSWYISKYDYDGNSKVTMIRFSNGAWSNKENLWS